MRNKRVNTIALDLTQLPNPPNNATLKGVLDYLSLDPTKMKSVQIHSSRKTVYFGLPADQSAADIATKHKLGMRIMQDGVLYPVNLAAVNEDVVDVRVRDVPPQTPNNNIRSALQKYGEVLTITDEVWRDFFPNAVTGTRLVRMHIKIAIPSIVHVGNSPALVQYNGQPETCRKCNMPSHGDNKCQKPAEEKQTKNKSTQQQDPQQNESKDPAKNNTSQKVEQKDSTQCTDSQAAESSAGNFITVKRRKGKKNTANGLEQCFGNSSSEEMDEEELEKLDEQQANGLSFGNFTKWLELKGGSKKIKK